MHHSGVLAAGRLGLLRGTFTVVSIALALLVSTALGTAASVRAAPSADQPAQTAAAQAAASLKAVIIVGPTHGSTADYLEYGEDYAQLAESYGMDVRRVFHPHATWEAVLANVQGANLVMYLGHGNGWPSPYTPFQEKTKNGVGLNPYDGASQNDVKYYGANPIRSNWVLAPNALVLLNHACYTAGSGEPGMPIPSWDVAHQRVDNFAAGFLAVGAGAVIAYAHQSFDRVFQDLFTTDKTVEEMFQTTGGWSGWFGWDPRYLDSERTPGATNLLDPSQNGGFLRAVTGDLDLTTAEWADGLGGGGGEPPAPPVLTDLSASAATGTATLTASGPELFTPNGDGKGDNLNLGYVVDQEAFVDFEVKNSTGNVVRTFSSWSPAGSGQATWDGKRANGDYVADGTFTVRATPRDRTGATGDPASVQVTVLTTMRAPSASPHLFFAADGDALAPSAALSVTLEEEATFWWKIVDAHEDVVRTHVNGDLTAPGALGWNWDGRDADGDFVPDGTYYSVMTASTDAGMYAEWVPVEVRAFRLSSSKAAPFTRGTTTTFFIDSTEPMSAKPKLKLYQPGLAVKTFTTTKVAPGRYKVKVGFSSAASPGTVTVRVQGTDTGSQVQWSERSYTLQ